MAMADCGISGSDSMCESTSAAFTESLIYAVPDDLIQTILQHLSATDLCHVASCSRWVRNLANRDSLWRHLCQSRRWEHYGTTTDLAKIASYIPSEEATGATEAGHDSITFQSDRIVTDDNTAGLTSTCRTKGVYMRAYHLDRNWATHYFQECQFKVEVEFATFYLLCFADFCVDEDLLAIHRSERIITVYDIRKQTKQCDVPAMKSRGRIKLRDGVIVLIGLDRRLYALDARTGKTLQTIEGNWSCEHRLLFFDGDFAITSSYEVIDGARFKDICACCVKDGKLQRILTADPTDEINMFYNVDYRDKMVAAADNDDYIRVWDARSGECLHKLKCPGEKSNVQLGDNVIVGFSTKGDECITSIWSQDTGECQKVIHVGLPIPNIGKYNPEIMNELILLEYEPDLRGSSVYAYNLRGELVTEMRYNKQDTVRNGSKCFFKILNELMQKCPKRWERVVLNATPNGLVRHVDVGLTKILWIDETKKIFVSNDEQKIVIHHYW